LLRSDLTVIDRLGPGTDKVSYPCPTSGWEKVVAFKAVACCSWYGGVWEDIQIMARLPPHSFILPLDSLVLEELTQLGVIGFTMTLVKAPTRDKHLTGPFKLRWLREVIRLIDELNLSFGLVHQNIAPRNIFIDPETDSILLFNFNLTARISQKRGGSHNAENPARNDVKGVMYFMYSIITRDPKCRFLQLDDAKGEELGGRTR
jgi:hypothetical protein